MYSITIKSFKTATGPDIYAECDASLKISFQDLRNLLKTMTKKGWLNRKQVSPSQNFTFTVLGNQLPFKIEMSPKNRRNKVYLYHNNIEYETMKNFIFANDYMIKTDSININPDKFKAVKDDSNLVQYLCQKYFYRNH